MKLIITLVLSTMVMVQPKPSPLDAALARMDAYLAEYEPKLSELIADEVFVQEINVPRNEAFMPREARSPGADRVRKRISSEVAFIALPDNAGWL